MDGVSAGKLEQLSDVNRSLLRSTRATEAAEAQTARNAPPKVDPTRVTDSNESQGGRDAGRESQAESSLINREELEALTQNLNRVFENAKEIRFDISDESGGLVVQVVNLQSEEVVRQIPPDRLVELQKNLDEFGPGLLLDDRG